MSSNGMSQPASRSSSASLRGVDLSAVRANLRALGHDVDEGQLVSMLESIDINEILGRSARGTHDTESRQQAQPVASYASESTAVTAPGEVQQQHSRSSEHEASFDGGCDQLENSSSSAAPTSAKQPRSRSRSHSESYLSDATTYTNSERYHQVDDIGTSSQHPGSSP